MWNVKKISEYRKTGKDVVLIETLWNVKKSTPSLIPDLSCINRNIVECKDGNGGNIFEYIEGINRNIVECKVVSNPLRLHSSRGINRNIVECKGKSLLIASMKRLLVLIETLWNVKKLFGDE